MTETKKWAPTPEQRQVLLALQAESNKLDVGQTEPNVAQFCREYATFSPGKFSKIMDVLDDTRPRSYFDEIKDRAGLMEELTDWLAKIPAMRLERESIQQKGMYKLSKFRAVAVAVREAKKESGPERIIKYIAPTGGAKTTLRRYLASEFRNELPFYAVESRDTWRPPTAKYRDRAKHTVLNDFCAALGLRNVDWSDGTPGVEDQVINFGAAMTRVMFIDEAEFFSAYALNLIKLLTNKTRFIFIIACTPRAHAKWNNYYADEADQISRRTRAVVALSNDDLATKESIEATLADVSLFFPKNQFANPTAALKYIADQAWVFGHYSTVARVAKELEKTSQAEQREVEQAVSTALKQMSKERTGRAK